MYANSLLVYYTFDALSVPGHIEDLKTKLHQRVQHEYNCGNLASCQIYYIHAELVTHDTTTKEWRDERRLNITVPLFYRNKLAETKLGIRIDGKIWWKDRGLRFWFWLIFPVSKIWSDFEDKNYLHVP